MWMMFTLLACRPDHQVYWEAPNSNRTFSEAISELFTPAWGEGDRSLLNVLHATGSSLDMNVSARSGYPVHDWSIESLRPLICQVIVPQTGPVDEVVPVTLAFHRQGATDLFVRDADGEIRDWQSIEIRDPIAPAVYAYEALAVGLYEPLDQIDVLAGAYTTLALGWQSEAGETLAGAGLLGVVTAEGPVVATVTDALAGDGLESFDLVVAADAEASATPLDLYAGAHRLRTVNVVVHTQAEVTNIVIEQDVAGPVEDEDGQVSISGFARAIVLTETVELVGVSVRWIQDGVEVGGGAWAEIGGADPEENHTIQACIGQLCATTTVRGHIVATFDTTAEAPPTFDGCGCGTEGLASGPAALGAWLLALVRRRRDHRGPAAAP